MELLGGRGGLVAGVLEGLQARGERLVVVAVEGAPLDALELGVDAVEAPGVGVDHQAGGVVRGLARLGLGLVGRLAGRALGVVRGLARLGLGLVGRLAGRALGVDHRHDVVGGALADEGGGADGDEGEERQDERPAAAAGRRGDAADQVRDVVLGVADAAGVAGEPVAHHLAPAEAGQVRLDLVRHRVQVGRGDAGVDDELLEGGAVDGGGRVEGVHGGGGGVLRELAGAGESADQGCVHGRPP